VDELKSPGKPFDISKRAVWEAYQKVKANKGAPGVDEVSIEEFEKDLKNNLFKIWNRMSSGSYFPPPVRAVDIAKPHGSGTRTLGVPTVISYCPSCNRVSGSSYWSCCAGGTVECHGAGWHRHFVIRFGCGVWCVELRG
jgi:hypothetical protein